MSKINVPTREEVSADNQAIFDNLKGQLTFVPNLYATMAHSENALSTFLALSGSKTSFSAKQKEVIDLAISQVNGCSYCQAAHTAIAKMNGFDEAQTIELRKGHATWDSKTDALAKIAKELAESKGNVSEGTKENFFNAGYSKENLVDLVVAAGAIGITNTLHNLTDVAIDFPAAPAL